MEHQNKATLNACRINVDRILLKCAELKRNHKTIQFTPPFRALNTTIMGFYCVVDSKGKQAAIGPGDEEDAKELASIMNKRLTIIQK